MNVFCGGSFDLFHIGHLRYIESGIKIANQVNGRLIVGLNTDILHEKYKSSKPIINYSDRKTIIQAIKGVDVVVPVRTLDDLVTLKRYDIHIYLAPMEWKNKIDDNVIKIIRYLQAKKGRIIYSPYFDRISTTKIKHKIIKESHFRTAMTG